MIRNILIFALCAISLNACVVSHSATSSYSCLPDVVQFKAESRFEYPMVMVETAMSIEAYESMSAQEKVNMGYIYNYALSTGEGKYSMERYYGFTLNMNGKSISEPDAEWIIKTQAGSFERYFAKTTMKLTRLQDSQYEYRLLCDYSDYAPYEIFFSRVEDEEDESYYSWKIEMNCCFETRDGYVVTVKTLGPVTRKVYRAVPNVSQCCVEMKGALQVSFEGDRNDDGQLEQLDVVKNTYDGKKITNDRYQF